ncbi:DNA/RNA helicase domain-containing protein [Malacoplasma iowae]|uniref:DUF2075 domain-containing protein n=1 Tax=Malacoplasma iowae 695 TaxID=1048830 RepID=A0A6P1LLR3_MALIO|nr:DNA/RNA helicase domain-containing protein [Malacoplasma iowae]QHG89432.1 DUF2075 domain-containing protein [Malacoplasma iowae 695]WPL35847.1 DUF2075 domain-containing protein [Malacoplasma iowae]VEU62884.1 Uncharacterized conserved protein [Mycoplasmopsis fermentans]VEU71637.1 Uncharacterized conserved protein [Malacoplasma iowae]
MIIYKKTIDEFIKDCDSDCIHAILLKELKERRGLNIGASVKEIESWKQLKKVANILSELNNKENQFVLLEYVIRDCFKRIDLIIIGKDHHENKNLAIVELKGWSTINLFKDSMLLYPNVSYGPCNHPSYEAYDYYQILTNMYVIDEIKFNFYCYSYLPNYEYSNINVLIDKRFSSIIEKSYAFCKNENNKFINILKNHFSNCIDTNDVDILDDLKYKPSKSFSKDLEEECLSIRLYGTQNITYNRIIDTISDLDKTKKKNLFLISGSAGSGKTVVAFKLMTHLRSLSQTTNLILPGPEFREAVKNIFKNKTSKLFIKGANSHDFGNRIDNLIIDEGHKATGRDSARVFYERALKSINKNIITFIDNQQVVNKKGITKDELKELAYKNNWSITELYLSEQFRSGGDISYIDFLKNIIFNEENYQEKFVNEFFDFKILDHSEFNSMYQKMYHKYNIRMVSFWTTRWDLNSLNPTVKIGNEMYIWNPNWQWLQKYKENGNKTSKEIENLCLKLNFNIDKKGPQYIGYFNTVQGYEFDFIFVHIPKLFFLNEKNEIDVDLSQLEMEEMKSQVWSISKIKNEEEKNNKEKLNKLYFLNRLFVNLTRGTKGTFVYIEDDKLRQHFKNKIIIKKEYTYEKS